MEIKEAVVDAIFKHVNPTGMRCEKCDRNYASLTIIEDCDAKKTELHLSCSRCMKTMAVFTIVP